MCQMIVKPAGVSIEKQVLHDAWMANDDGAGFAFRNEKNEVLFCKGYFKFKHLWKAYKKIEQYDVLLHFRLATHGEKVVENCHPFQIGGGAMMAHNGILYDFQPLGQDTRSDTRIFLDTVIAPSIVASQQTADEFLGDWHAKVLLETWTKGNKFAALAPGGFYIFNESAGTWRDKVWYSSGYPSDQKWWLDSCPSYEGYGNSKWDEGWRGSLGLSNSSTQGARTISETSPGVWSVNDRGVQTYLPKSERILALPHPEKHWERCEVCDEFVPKCFSLGKERICGACWNEFGQVDTEIEG